MQLLGLGYIYALFINAVIAKSKEDDGALLFVEISPHRVKSINPGGGEVTLLQDSLNSPRDITFNSITNTVYVVNYSERNIVSFTTNDPKNQTLVTSLPDSGRPWGIAVDTIRRHLYLTDYVRRVIYRLDTDGGNLVDWVNIQGDVFSIAVAEVSGYVYWTELDHDIVRLSVTDPKTKEIVLTDIDKTGGLHIDEELNTIYWCTQLSGVVKSADLVGDNRRTITTVSEANYLWYISSLPGHLYVTGRRELFKEYFIFDIRLHDGTYTKLQTNERIWPYSIVAIQNKSDACRSSSCQNEGSCKDEIDGHTCVCKSGFSGTSCETNINECASSPCMNGATCENGIDVFTCICNVGYTGSFCKAAILEDSSTKETTIYTGSTNTNKVEQTNSLNIPTSTGMAASVGSSGTTPITIGLIVVAAVLVVITIVLPIVVRFTQIIRRRNKQHTATNSTAATNTVFSGVKKGQTVHNVGVHYLANYAGRKRIDHNMTNDADRSSGVRFMTNNP